LSKARSLHDPNMEMTQTRHERSGAQQSRAATAARTPTNAAQPHAVASRQALQHAPAMAQPSRETPFS
jgi:hypothetical protein